MEHYFPGIDLNDRDGMVPLVQQIDLVRDILDDPDETLGLRLGMNLPFDGLGLWGFLLRSSNNFGDMLTRAGRYIRVVNKYPEFVLEMQGDRLAQICTHSTPSPFGAHEQIVQWFLAHWLAWGRLLCNQALAPVQASFTWAGPLDPGPFTAFYQCPVRFDAEVDALLFDRRTLDAPLFDATPQLSGEFEKYAAAYIERLTHADGLLPRVRAAIEEGLIEGRSQEGDVAARLAMTTRTLHRRLKAQATSFRALRDQILRQKAEDLLRRADIPIAEVSFLLGYSEASNFYRAFKRWTGSVPSAWREKHGYGQ